VLFESDYYDASLRQTTAISTEGFFEKLQKLYLLNRGPFTPLVGQEAHSRGVLPHYEWIVYVTVFIRDVKASRPVWPRGLNM